MKLRIHENSLRLRLSQSEVAQFSKTGFVEDSINFAPGSNFAYTLESSSSIPSAQASYQNGWFRIQVPAVAATEWFSTDRVSISGRAAATIRQAANDPGRERFPVPAWRLSSAIRTLIRIPWKKPRRAANVSEP